MTGKNGTGMSSGADDVLAWVAQQKGWRVENGPVSREMGGKMQLWKGTTCLWREFPGLWIAADWDTTPDGEAYRWQNHREYKSFESALRGETG